MTAPAPVHRVLCVDDHRSFVEALHLAIGDEPDIECVGMAGSVDAALVLLDERHPDTVLLDVDLAGDDGIEGIAALHARRPGVRVIVLTGMADLRTLQVALAAGARGFVSKDRPLDEVLDAIRAPADGGPVVGPGTLQGLTPEPRAADAVGGPPLTRREAEVLGLLADGLDIRRIAATLHISVHTCRGYVRDLLGKLGAHSQLEAVVIAGRLGLVRH